MNALIFDEINQYPKYKSTTIQKNDDDQVVVELKASALNHRDVWITKGMYPGIQLPMILGSDGAGVFNNQDVVINPNVNWGSNEKFQGVDYQVLGMPSFGTFAESIVVHKDRIFKKPEHLSYLEAAALPLTGLTAYRALFTKAQLKKGEKVLISGIGGGVALMAFQMAMASGAEVFVSSSSSRKLDKALSMGAHGGIKYTDDNWIKQLKEISGGIDVIIDGAGGDGVGQLLSACNPGARYVMYGGTRGNINNISPQLLFWRQISIMGTTMGSDDEFQKLIDFVEFNKIRPVVDTVFPLSEGEDGFERMDQGLQFGKIVFDHAK